MNKLDFSLNEYLDIYHDEGAVSPSSVKTMKYNLLRVLKIIDKIPFNKSHDEPILLKTADFEEINTIKDKIEEQSLNTQAQSFVAINFILNLFKETHAIIRIKKIYTDLAKKVQYKLNNKIGKNELTEKEKENWIDFEELKAQYILYANKLEFNDNYKFQNKTFFNLRDTLLMGLFVLMPPTRIGNYRDMLIRKKVSRRTYNKKYNYLVIDEDKYSMIFNQYKTAKQLGEIKIKITDEIIIKLLEQYLLERDLFNALNKINNNYKLFTNKHGEFLAQSQITNGLKKISKEICDKELSCNMFRHIFLTDYQSKEHTIEQKIEMARLVGQTYNAPIMEKYKKISNEVHFD